MSGAATPVETGSAERVRSALILRFGGIGDIVLATPAIRGLAQRYPGLAIDMLVGSGMRDAIGGHPDVRDIFVFDKQTQPDIAQRIVATGRLLRSRRYDLLINFQPSVKSLSLAALAAPRHTVVFRKDRRIQPGIGRVRHAVDDYLAALAPLGVAAPRARALDFIVPAAARHAIAHVLADAKVEPGDRLAVLNPTALRTVNRWPAPRWAHLADALSDEQRVRVALVGGPQERAEADAVLTECAHRDKIVDLAGSLSLKELGALIERSALVVTGDTGPMHIAAALCRPLVCLSGAADPDRTGPLTPNSTVLIDRSRECVPCARKHCCYGERPPCMDSITPESVVAACRMHLMARPVPVLQSCA